ncbi:pentatricopeptide repeat-containing protein At5g46460, mitochondrial-like [Eucalyptus grandis]|uniref:pentatricopeptide repeat-containing protein At5g46460, mitochondrial-like n=1 Tax=Eucalyptus grandis TaxID=71139 RepID=UPI00192EC20A|nr:pentatricopeptide repeat-containing protein At5g46460, mitochondrial-like [Eucalyptus grandis]
MPIRDLVAWNAMLHGYREDGRVDNAVKLFEKMPSQNVISWTSMIAGLDQNVKSEEALIVIERMFKHEDGLKVFSDRMRTSVLLDQSSFVSALNSRYSLESQIEGDIFRLRVTMRDRGIVKQPSSSRLKELDHVPDKIFSFHDIKDKQKEESLSYHSERLAVPFALISTVKDGMIVDCEIVVTNSSRFGHFRGGICSCGDYQYQGHEVEFEAKDPDEKPEEKNPKRSIRRRTPRMIQSRILMTFAVKSN